LLCTELPTLRVGHIERVAQLRQRLQHQLRHLSFPEFPPFGVGDDYNVNGTHHVCCSPGSWRLFRSVSLDRIDPAMNTMHLPTKNTATDTIERWLTIQLTGATGSGVSDLLATIKGHSPSERVLALYQVLGRSPDLAWRVERLPVLEQLQLSLDLVGDAQQILLRTRTVAPLTTGRCRARLHGRPRRP
jgi:hypothetical protein